MDEQRATIGGIHPRRLAAVVGLVVLVGLAILAAVFYRQIGSLLRPALRQPAAQIAETQDVRVQRGHITKVLRLMGAIQPSREAKLAFQVAQGEVIAVPVNTGQTVKAGQTLVELDVAVLERELAKLRAGLLGARSELSDLIDESGLVKRIQLQEELRQANAALDQARRELGTYEAGKGTPQEKRAQAAADLANAKVDLAVLRESKERQQQIEQLQVTYNLAENKHGPYVLILSPSEKDIDTELLLRNDMLDRREALDQAKLQYEMDIRAAEQRVAVAEQTLAALDRGIAAGSPTIEHMRREAAVQQATAKVQQILAQLAALDEATLDVEVAKAQAKVLKLEGKVADAETAMAEATLVAPFDGVVDEVKVAPGATVSAGTELVTIFSASSFYVLARVNEIEIAQLRAGQDAQLTFDALGGQVLAGQLGEIPSFGTYQNGLTVFDVKVAFDAGELPLRAGMSANVNVPLFRKEDVLIIPAMAVQRDADGPFVIVVEGRRTERRTIRLGITDGINIEVVEGLEKGEVVRMALQGPIQPR
jgi:HlyD family secretion protein